MKAADQEKLVQALAFALEAHGDQKRKGKDVPYVSHLLQVSGFVFEYGGDVDLAVAGLLHDVIEDCPGITYESIEERFGKRVAGIVNHCTDLLEDDTPGSKSDWRTRKERYLRNLSEANRDTRLVALCDKLHNLSNVLADLRARGISTMKKFSAGPDQQLWYFEGVRAAALDGLPEPLVAEFDLHLAKFREYVAVAGAL
jgi:(p)ppGpp synthase/HD superfamily hydrolase